MGPIEDTKGLFCGFYFVCAVMEISIIILTYSNILRAWTILAFLYHVYEVYLMQSAIHENIKKYYFIRFLSICLGWLVSIGGFVFFTPLITGDTIETVFFSVVWTFTTLYILSITFMICVISCSIGVKWLKNRNHINLLLVQKFSEWKDIETNCAICLEDYGNKDLVAKLNCGHYFHQHCLQAWLKQSETCPYCVQSIKDGTNLCADSV